MTWTSLKSALLARRMVGLVVVVVAGAALLFLSFRASGDTDRPDPTTPPVFLDETDKAGITHAYEGGFTYFVGGGVAVFDCNEDSKPDIFLAGGEEPAGLYRNDSDVGGELRFTKIGSDSTDQLHVTGAYPLDIDADGRIDLAVLKLGEDVLLRGEGDCRFERANERWDFDGGEGWTTAFSATWEASATLPTLAFGNYLNLTAGNERAEGCADNVLVRPAADGRFGVRELLSPGFCSLSILFSDWSRSGRPDLRISNDRQYNRDGTEQMWRVEADAHPSLFTSEDGWRNVRINGMGIASHDVTGDGFPEVFLTSMGDNKLQTLVEGSDGPEYEDIALALGVTAHRPFFGDAVSPSTAWHAEFQDVNNDGLIDLFVAKGNVDAMVEFATDDPNNLLIGQVDGTFLESADISGISSVSRTRGAALVDLNLDGMLDLVEVNRSDPVRLWRNVGWGDDSRVRAMGGWLAVELVQPGPNRSAIGSWIEVRTPERTQRRELTIGGGHAGGQLGWVHFGIGSADEVELQVHWPDGELGPLMTVDSNTFLVVERGQAEPLLWDPEDQ